MSARLAWIAAALALCSAAASSSALAQDLRNEQDGYLAAKLMLGIGGEGEIGVDGLGGVDLEGDLETSYGLGVAYVHPLHDYFALGGQLGVLSWTSDFGDAIDLDRNTLLDLSIVPQLKYAVLDSLELYVSLPVGLTLNFFGEGDSSGTDLGEVNDGFGFNLALLLGARVALTDGFGLLVEAGYAYHAFTHSTETVLGDGPDIEISLGQLALSLGGYFQL